MPEKDPEALIAWASGIFSAISGQERLAHLLEMDSI